MTEPGQLLLVDSNGEVRGEACYTCQVKDRVMAQQARELSRLRNEERDRLALAADAPTILDILEHHKRWFPGSKIIRGKTAWKAVRARLADIDEQDERVFTPTHLKAAAMGLKLRRLGGSADRPHGAAWLYSDEERTLYFLDQCAAFTREAGRDALVTVLDELGKPGFVWLVDRCFRCDQIRLAHLAGWTDHVFDEAQVEVERMVAARS